MRRALLAAGALLALGAAPAHATLAYVKGALRGKPVLYVANDDGTGARKLAGGAQWPKVSPDGLQVAYVTGSRRASLKLRPAAGGPARTLARDVWNYDAIQWSPDSTRLSVTTGPELGPYTLKVIDLTTGEANDVQKGFFYGASWAPDNSGIAWAKAARNTFPVRANLYRADLDGSGIVRLTDDFNATSPVWGPSLIAFSRARKAVKRGDYDKLDIYTIDAEGNGRKRLTRTNPPFLLAGLSPLAWSADGTRLAANYSGQDTTEAWRVDAPGGGGGAVDATGKFDGVVGWGLAKDGSALLATTGYFDNPAGDVVSVAWEGRAQTVLARRATMPSWSR